MPCTHRMCENPLAGVHKTFFSKPVTTEERLGLEPDEVPYWLRPESDSDRSEVEAQLTLAGLDAIVNTRRETFDPYNV